MNLLALFVITASIAQTIDLESISPDLITPQVANDPPAAGKRVRQVQPDYVATDVHHLLYLPTDWVATKKYPVIVEYAGNHHKSSPGTVEGSNLGYGISGGRGMIWVCLPFVDRTNGRNALSWWGDVDATVAYCRETVARICRDYGGDSERVLLAGFSRGSIACNFIGLHDDEIARLWCGFICHSHYDGVREWPYPGSDRRSAAERLRRLGSRPQFISHEADIQPTKTYLAQALP
ncbi:MAG TPA: hypothetical protein VL475_12045, partial [Planctomycetaceae bacterium]|nr:hypothetical protein [Planctomycetaceae bacterium]